MHSVPKPLRWLVPSKDELLDMPEDVIDEIGYKLNLIQHGEESAEPGIKRFHEDARIAHLYKVLPDGARETRDRVSADRSKGKMTDEKLVAFGSGNVFADLGVPNPEEHLAKSRLVAKISAVIRERGLTQTQASELTGIPQPKISGLMRGRFRDFSLDRLCRMLNGLGVKVTLVLADQPQWLPGDTTVSDAGDTLHDGVRAMAM